MPANRVRLVGFLEGFALGRIELQINGGHGIVEVLHLARPDDGSRDPRLPKQPRQRHLRIAEIPLARYFAQSLDHREV
jgi:hypothetical protein